MVYEIAPGVAFHEKLTGRKISPALFAGLERKTSPGSDGAPVRKFQTGEYGLIPPLFRAFTRQKSVKYPGKPSTVRIVSVNEESLMKLLEKVESQVETCSL
jgi:hypothetical protein